MVLVDIGSTLCRSTFLLLFRQLMAQRDALVPSGPKALRDDSVNLVHAVAFLCKSIYRVIKCVLAFVRMREMAREGERENSSSVFFCVLRFYVFHACSG